MGKTYSKKQKWIDFNNERGTKISRHRKHGLVSLGWKSEDSKISEKLCRHPNKKSNKSNLRKELYESLCGCTIADVRNPCGEIYDRSSRIGGLRKVMNGIRRSHMKEMVRKEIENADF